MGLEDGGLRLLSEIGVPGVIDNFEDAPDGPYAAGETITDYYTGNTGDFTRQTSTVESGTTALTGTRDGSNLSIISTSGLPNYPSQGDKIEMFLNGDHADYGGALQFGVQDLSNHYRAIFFNDLQIDIRKDGSSVASQSFSGDHSNEWLRIVVDWHDGSDLSAGTIEFEAFDSTDTSIASISTQDPEYSSGGIGYRVTRADTVDNFDVHFDTIQINGTAGD